MRKVLSLIVCVLMIASLVGCAASKSESMNIGYGSAVDSMSNGIFGDYESSDGALSPEEVEQSNRNDAAQYGDSSTGEYLQTQKLIYSCTMTVETLEFNQTTSKIKELINTYGGFVESDVMSDDSWDWYSSDYQKDSATLRETIKIRIPTEQYEAFLNEIDGVAKIRNKNESVTNITKKYNDTKTVIEMYEKEERMLLEMMDKATSIADMLTVETRLSEVQRNLALYRSTMGTMETDLAFSTITMTITEVMQYTRVESQLSFVERVTVAISESWTNFIDFAEGFFIFIIHLAPFAVVSIVTIAVLISIIKRRKNKRMKLAAISAEKQQEQEIKIADIDDK